MRKSFNVILKAFTEVSNKFDAEGKALKMTCLKDLSLTALSLTPRLLVYYDTLLYILAYPSDAAEMRLAEKEMLRIARFLQKEKKQQHKSLINSGMPFTQVITRFSHDKVRWLLAHPHCKTILDDFVDPSHSLNDVLKLTLPSIERSETTAGRENMDLMDTLKIPVAQRMPFLINELSRLDHLPYIKDHLFDRLEPIVCVTPNDKLFSKAYNRLQVDEIYFHDHLLKKFNSFEILDTVLPAHVILKEVDKEEVIRVVKNAMVLTARETDPCTYMDENSLRLYQLGRGISIAIFGMVPARQMPLESYVGYTAFKNGFPVSYGGAWIFGGRANFGINIFKPYRNGESAFIMAQLLRVYRHTFSISHFEVEPYQFGLDNPDGIASGAFWFYYRFGFRPLDKHLREVANREAEKINTRKGYRTSHKVLLSFTESYLALSLGKKIPPKVGDIMEKVTHMIARRFKGNRLDAEKVCRQNFSARTGHTAPLSPAEEQVLTEVALWAAAMTKISKEQFGLMAEMVRTKPLDVYAYQTLLHKFFSLDRNSYKK